MDDICIFVGDPKSSTAFQDITLISPRGRPTIKNGQKPFIEVNAQKNRLLNVSTRLALAGGTFGSYVQVDDDEAFLLDGLDTSLGGGGVRCDATVCNPAVYAPGPFGTSAAVGWLKHLNISMQCGGNGIDWQSGNTLRISDSVIQGYAQYGVRAGTRRGGYGGFELENVYEEVGNCANPLGKIGQAGVIAQGGSVRIHGEARRQPEGSRILPIREIRTTATTLSHGTPNSAPRTRSTPVVPRAMAREISQSRRPTSLEPARSICCA